MKQKTKNQTFGSCEAHNKEKKKTCHCEFFWNQWKNKKPRSMKCRGAKCKNEINDMFSLNLKP